MGDAEQLKLLERHRLKAGRLLLKGVPQAEVARRTGVARSTVCGWAGRLAEGGLDALRSQGPRGRPASLGIPERKQLRRLLLAGAMAEGFPTEVWILPRVRTVVAKHFGVTLSEPQIWRILRAMKFSPQRPARRARQRDEKAVEQWKKETWPRLKKTPKNRGE